MTGAYVNSQIIFVTVLMKMRRNIRRINKFRGDYLWAEYLA